METTLDRHIETTPEVCSGRPRIAGRRMTVADVVIMYLRLGQSLEEVSSTYDVSLAALYAAISYYYDHQAEIDRQIQEDEDYVEAFAHTHPSRLQAKLKALRSE